MKENVSPQKGKTPFFIEIEKELEKYKEILKGEIEEEKKRIDIQLQEALKRVDHMAQTTMEEVKSEWADYEKKIESFRHEQNETLEGWFAHIITELEQSTLVSSLVTESIASLCHISEKQERSH